LYLSDRMSTKAFRITIASTASKLHQLKKDREAQTRVVAFQEQPQRNSFVYESSDESSDGFEIMPDVSAQERELKRLLDSSDDEGIPQQTSLLQTVRNFFRAII